MEDHPRRVPDGRQRFPEPSPQVPSRSARGGPARDGPGRGWKLPVPQLPACRARRLLARQVRSHQQASSRSSWTTADIRKGLLEGAVCRRAPELSRSTRRWAGSRTRRAGPGPSTWELGIYPEGHADDPVNGVSWYEAAAYAEFAGKSLPTIYHWYNAAGVGIFSDILRLSNFAGKGPAPVGSHQGLAPSGAYDMAGNVKEWCWNTSGDRRYILGGAWSDPGYMFSTPDAQLPFDRSATNGLRCAKYGRTRCRRAGGSCRTADARLLSREARARRGVPDLSRLLRLRPDALERRDRIVGRELTLLAQGKGRLRRRLWPRASSGIPVPAAQRRAPLQTSSISRAPAPCIRHRARIWTFASSTS